MNVRRTSPTARRAGPIVTHGDPRGHSVVPRSWKSSDAVAAAREFFARPRSTAARELIRMLCSADPFAHRCAAELARCVSRRQPGILSAYADILADVAAELPAKEWQARGYGLVAAALNTVRRSQRQRLLPLVRARLADERIAVRAMALEAFAFLAVQDRGLQDEALQILEEARHSSIPAFRMRARLMLPKVLEAQTRSSCPVPQSGRKCP